MSVNCTFWVAWEKKEKGHLFKCSFKETVWHLITVPSNRNEYSDQIQKSNLASDENSLVYELGVKFPVGSTDSLLFYLPTTTFAVCCLLFAFCYFLFAVCFLLFAVCCLLLTATDERSWNYHCIYLMYIYIYNIYQK